MEPATSQIERLPEELLVHVISLTSPAGACSAAAVSRAFRAAADSEVVWSRFLPRDLPRLAKNELTRTPPTTKKGLVLRLVHQPALLQHKLVRMQLDKATGAKCFALSARSLQFTPKPTAWGPYWINLGFDKNTRDNRFLQAAELPADRELEIRGKIHPKMLSENSTYAAYMVFKVASRGTYDKFQVRDVQFDEASITIGGRESKQRVCLVGYAEDRDDGITPDDTVSPSPRGVLLKPLCEEEHCVYFDLGENVVASRRRADGWMEVELGEFYSEGGDNHVEVSATFGETFKRDFLILRIDIRSRCKS